MVASCEQTRHLGESREFTQEPPMKGDGKVRSFAPCFALPNCRACSQAGGPNLAEGTCAREEVHFHLNACLDIFFLDIFWIYLADNYWYVYFKIICIVFTGESEGVIDLAKRIEVLGQGQAVDWKQAYREVHNFYKDILKVKRMEERKEKGTYYNN